MGSLQLSQSGSMRKIFRLIKLLLLLDLALIVIYVAVSLVVIRTTAVKGNVNAVALFFASFGEINGLSTESIMGVEQAKRLYDEDPSRVIICLGGGKPAPPRRGAELMCDMLSVLGVPQSNLIVDSLSWDTRTNWKELERLSKEHRLNTIVAVSSPVHMLRILHLSSDSNLVVYLAPHRWFETSVMWELVGIWQAIHHEFVAWVATLFLSEEQYDHLIRRYRELGLELI